MRYNPPRFLFRRFSIIKNVKPGNIFLEIGPGNLNLSIDLIDIFNKGVLIDFNTTEVETIFNNLPEKYKQKLNLIIADFVKYDNFPSKFDSIITCEVLEHVEEEEAFLRRIFDLLIDNGQLILSVPARKKYWSIHDEIVGHLRRYEKKELFDKLSAVGFSDIKIVSYGFPFIIFFRLLRIQLAKNQYKEKAEWTKIKQSQKSGITINSNSKLNFVSYVINKYTFFPLFLVSSMFNKFDLSDGYLATAKKNIQLY